DGRYKPRAARSGAPRHAAPPGSGIRADRRPRPTPYGWHRNPLWDGGPVYFQVPRPMTADQSSAPPAGTGSPEWGSVARVPLPSRLRCHFSHRTSIDGSTRMAATNDKPTANAVTWPICLNGTRLDTIRMPNPAMVVNADPARAPPVWVVVERIASSTSS